MVYNINVVPSTEQSDLSMLVVTTEDIKSAVSKLSTSYEILSVHRSREIRKVIVASEDPTSILNLYEIIIVNKVDTEVIEIAEYVLAADLVSAISQLDSDAIVSADLYTEKVRFYEL